MTEKRKNAVRVCCMMPTTMLNCCRIVRKRKEQLYDYNRLRPSQQEEKTQLLKSFWVKTGNNLIIEPPFACDYGYNIEVGENFYANVNLVILDGAKVRIGANAFIAPNVGIYTAGHPLDAEQRNRGLEYARPVTIGHNVWIGAGVNILPGVTIGDNTVIGAGSVVNKRHSIECTGGRESLAGWSKR